MFYKAVLIVIDAVRTFALRYSALARELAEKQTDAARRAELLEMSRICAKVPYEPVESFREAVQSVWFIQLILQIESNGHSLTRPRSAPTPFLPCSGLSVQSSSRALTASSSPPAPPPAASSPPS